MLFDWIRQGDADQVRAVQAAGVVRGHEAKDGRTPADVARQDGHPEVAGEVEGA